MPTFEDFDDWADNELRLPAGGKVYVIPDVPDALGLRVKRLFVDGVALSDVDEDTLYREILGPVYDELTADSVPARKAAHIRQTALIWVGLGTKAAEAFWASGSRPEAPRPANRAARRATKSASTAGAKRTR